MTDTNTPTVLIAGTARDCSKTLQSTLELLEPELPEGWFHRWFVVESDSTDDTLDVLERLSESRSNFEYVSKGSLRSVFPSVAERLAYCRNLYLERARELGVDFLIVADLDGVVQRLPEGLLGNLLTEDDDWAGLFANQLGPYYDLAALRHSDWVAADPFSYANFLVTLGYSRREASRKAISERMLVIPPTGERIRVDSAFGGLGIYRMSAVGEFKYAAQLDGSSVCEHVPLNAAISRAGTTLYIEPRLAISSFTEHTYQLRRVFRFLAKFTSALERILGSKNVEALVVRVDAILKKFPRVIGR